jgi:predicted enzyme related to lactoylglutathione lyase
VRVDDVVEALTRAEQAGGTRLAGPFGSGSDGGFAVLADPAGVPFCLRQAGENDGAELANEPSSWAMSSLHTTDVELAQEFYGQMFDWELEPVPDAAFSLWRRSGRVVAVRDVDSIAQHAVALGGTILIAPMNTAGFRNAVIGDPQGGVIAVSAAA